MNARQAYFRTPPADLLARWQESLDLLAESGRLPLALIARRDGPALVVALVNKGGEHWVPPGVIKPIGCGTFCDAVLHSGRPVHVRDARRDPAWAAGIDQAGGMTSYIGYPLCWPDGTLFGVICALDTQPNDFDGLFCRHLEQVVRALEAELAAFDENQRLRAEIAAHEETEGALRQSERLHTEVQRIAMLGHWHHDLTTDALSWSDEMYRIYEVERDAFAPDYRVFLALLHPDDRELLDQRFRQAIRERKPFELEYRLLMPDGRTKWMLAHAVTRYAADGTPLESLGTTQDITSRRAAERERELLADIVRNTRELVNVATLEGQMVFLNEAGGRMLGIAPEDAAAHHILEVIPEHLLAIVGEELLPSLMDGGQWEGRLQYRNLATGALRDYHAVCFAVKDSRSGAINYLANVSTDITDRLAAERERASLERQVAHTQRLESLGLMAGSVAHDFNNLLQAILGNLELVAATASDPAAQQDALQRARQAAITGAGITRQLLTFAGRDNPPQARIDLAQLVDESARLLRAVIGKRITLNVASSGDALPVSAVASQLQQVIINLVMNAADAVAAGSGTVTVDCGVMAADAKLLARSPIAAASSADHFAWIEVSDNGCGMDRDTVARLFEPFFTTKPHGRGLGMPSVLGIVRSHGGAIVVDSEPGAGTRIRILLPLAVDAPPAAGAPPRPSATPSAALAGRHVLLVDDEPTIRIVTAALLERAGATVTAAESGEEALRQLDGMRAPPDVVVLDLTMPGLDGADTFLHLRARAPAVPVLLASGYDRAQAMARIGDAPRVAFIEKPWRTEELLAALTRLLHAG